MNDETYICRGYTLICHKAAFLVEIELHFDKNATETSISDLPDWIFSEKAIWLTLENESMFLRATHGDEIKQAFWDVIVQNNP